MEDFVLNHMTVFDCTVFAIMTIYGILLVSWFFDTVLWDWFTDLVDELQFFIIALGLIFSAWYLGCAIFGWEYRLIPHILGLISYGTFIVIVFSICGWGWLSDLRDEVVSRRRKNR